MQNLVKRTSKGAIAHLRQLCCLGLGGEAVMQDVLHTLHDVVKSDSNAFFWVDEHLDIANMCAERMLRADLIREYFREYYQHPVLGFKARFREVARSEHGVNIARFDESFYRSDYYGQVWRSLRAHRALYAVVQANGKPLGQLSLYRTANEPEFTRQEANVLASVSRYISHALSAQPGLLDGITLGHHESADTGVIIFNTAGEQQDACRNGHRLLLLASYPKIGRSTVGLPSGSDVPAALTQLCQNLLGALRGARVQPPVLSLENWWGKFTFRAHLLTGALGNETSGLIGVTVTHEKPKALVLLDRMVRETLSVRERDVALLLAAGRSRNDIGERIGVRTDTVGYYVKQIYGKLDVHDPREMVEVLLH